MKVTTVTFEGTPEEYREYLVATAAVTNITATTNTTTGRSDAFADVSPVDVQEFMRRVINRMPLPDRQIALFRTLYDADGQQLTKSELEARMGRTPQELSGVLGALGRRIRGTPGSKQVTHQIGVAVPIEVFLEISQINGKWCYTLRPELRQLLESENIIRSRQ